MRLRQVGSLFNKVIIFLGLDSSTSYIFQDTNAYEVSNGRVIGTRSISEMFPRGPRFVEAAFANPRSESIMLFNGGQVNLELKEDRA